MLNAVYCEFLKLKRSKFYLLLLISTCYFPIVTCSNFLGTNRTIHWTSYIFQAWQWIPCFFTIPVSTLIVSYIFTNEFHFKTMSTLFCYPLSKIKVFFSKLIASGILIALAVFFQLLLVILIGLLLKHDELTSQIFFAYLKINLYELFCIYAILPIVLLISLICKNSIVPLGFSFIICTANMFISICIINMSKFKPSSTTIFLYNNKDYFVTYYPELLFQNCVKSIKTVMNISLNSVPLHASSIFIALITFAIGIILCLLYYSKREIK